MISKIRAMSTIPISSVSVTVDKGTFKIVPIQGQFISRPVFKALTTPIAPMVKIVIVMRYVRIGMLSSIFLINNILFF